MPSPAPQTNSPIRSEIAPETMTAKKGGEWIFSGSLRLNVYRRKAEIQDNDGGYRELSLTPSEFRLLCHFALHPGVILSREILLKELWGERGAEMSGRAIDVHICQLRKKLPFGPCRIEAVYGAGYRYVDGLSL